MQMIQVSSSNIKAIGWEDGTLRIEFNNGGTYEYLEVSEEEFNSLKNASSVGSYYHQNIKGNYECNKI